MRELSTVIAILALLAGCGNSPAEKSRTASPDLGACAASELSDEDYREREGPILVPSEFVGKGLTDMDHLAVTTFSGATICVDMGWMETIERATASPDRRFLAFDWTGYEAFGHIVIDRSGNGQILETGNAPLASPSGMRIASVDLSESGFGGFNAFGVWQIEAAGLSELAKVQDRMPPGDWRITGWSGDDCVKLSLLPIERQPSDVEDFGTAARDTWFAAESSGWTPSPGDCPSA